MIIGQKSLLESLWVSCSLAGDCTLSVGETCGQWSWGSECRVCTQDLNYPPWSPLCCEAPPFVCHLFTLLAQATLVSTMRSRSTAPWIGCSFFILTLVTSERQWFRAWQVISSSKAQRHSTYPIKRVHNSASLCFVQEERPSQYHIYYQSKNCWLTY